MSTFTVYVTQQNSDQTEGRGHMRDVSCWDNEGDAVQDAQGRGVMGVGPGDVVVRIYTFPPQGGEGTFYEEKVYGYRKDPNGNWGYGYVDNREWSDKKQDSEWAEFLRLSEKFKGGRYVRNSI